MDKTILSNIRKSLKPKFIVLPFRVIRNGTVFLPIEKAGRSVYFRDRHRRLVKEKQWAKGSELFVKASNALSRSTTSDKDAVFGLYDWCVVREH